MASPTLNLGGVALPHLIWVDEYQVQDIAQSTKRTLGGGLVVYEQNLIAGRPITLEATEDQGWLTKAQVESLRALEAVATSYNLQVGGQNFTVIFRRDEGPAIEVTPIVFRINSEDTDYFTGLIRLLTV